MYTIRKIFNFEASHRLKYHEGKCRRLHGHSYRTELELESDELQVSGPEKNMVVDYQFVSKVVNNLVISHLDHSHLNDSLETDSPTAEYIAFWIYNKLKAHLPFLTAVTVRETANTSATYRPAQRNTRCACQQHHSTIELNGIANGTTNGSTKGIENEHGGGVAANGISNGSEHSGTNGVSVKWQ